MKIRTQNEQEITASKSLYGKLEPVLFLGIVGTVFYVVAPTLLGIVCWLLAGLYLISAILSPEGIIVDSIQKVIIIRRPIFGLFPGKQFIP